MNEQRIITEMAARAKEVYADTLDSLINAGEGNVSNMKTLKAFAEKTDENFWTENTHFDTNPKLRFAQTTKALINKMKRG